MSYEIIKNGLLELNFSLEHAESLSQKMDSYIKEIILYNSAYNLTNTSDYSELATRHVLDSLAAYHEIFKQTENIKDGGSLPLARTALLATPSPRRCPPKTQQENFSDESQNQTNERSEVLNKLAVSSKENFITIADIGSGGGLPGIPLAAAFEQNQLIRFELVERMEKRCSFLENCIAILGLKNVTVINSEAERIPPESYDLITFRAFRPLDKKMTKTLLKITKTGGVLCAYKAKMQNIREEMDSIKNLVPNYTVVPLTVPGMTESERNLVVIGK